MTPSSAQALSECQLRLAYASDRELSRQVPSTQAARLGTACHKVLQAAGEGRLPDPADAAWRAAFEKAWQEAVGEQAAYAAASPLESGWGAPERWRFYSMRKVATRRLAERVSRSAHGDPGGSSVLHETAQEAYGGRLRGRADVIKRGAHPEIQDYKTGAIVESEEGGIKPSYRTQMLLYALLEHADSGIWPQHATLIPLEGEQASIDIDPGEAKAVAEDCLSALDAYNRSVSDRLPVAGLASATPNSCHFCPYAVRCPAFWETLDAEWAEAGIRALAGPVVTRETAQLGAIAIKIEAVKGTSSGEIWLYGLDPARFPASALATTGQWLAATAVIGLPGSARFRPSEQTRLIIADPPA